MYLCLLPTSAASVKLELVRLVVALKTCLADQYGLGDFDLNVSDISTKLISIWLILLYLPRLCASAMALWMF
jgi:hypothetical protein